jgi:hypothetical protein
MGVQPVVSMLTRLTNILRAPALALVCIAALALPSAAFGQGGAPSVNVFPIPGARVAAPRTQITFRGVSPSAIGDVTVRGSMSGVHTGTIKGDSDGHGGSFLPASPFTPGEVVTVSTTLNIVGANHGTFSFTVATPAPGLPPSHFTPAARVGGDVWRYHSQPGLAPAAVRLSRWSPHAAPGAIFLAPQDGPVQDGPEIIGPGGGLIWFHPIPNREEASDFKVQTYRGRPVLTWWQGYVTAGVGVGEDEIYNTSYQPVATVKAGNGLSSDLHEFKLTPQNTALVTAYYPVYWDATSVRGPKRETVLDAVVQEIDIPTGLVLFQWDSLDHVPLTATYAKVPNPHTRNPFDYFHVNAAEEDDDGNLLISARNTWAIYKVNHETGQIMWTLGGKQSSFRLGPGASFAFQHDARVRAANDLFITIFDDGAGPPAIERQSRAIKLILDLKHMTARLVAQHEHGLLANFEGSDQQLPDRDDFVGWGQQPYFSEYDPHGKLIFDGRFVDTNSSYRAFRFQWNAIPATPPSIEYTAGSHPAVAASWNGATTVSAWRVLGGDGPSSLAPVTTTRKTWFETWIPLRTAPRYVAVQALDGHGHVLGTSPVVTGH